MKLSKLIVFSLLVTLNAVATEIGSENLAPPSQVEEYFYYCTDTLSDEEGTDEHILNCVNYQLVDSGFKQFSTYAEMIAHINKKGDE
ncbi:hypothetical protein [Litorilituus sediminis]|uniref:Uncharacterized protein n=1 Tax=Litorilituus sediminis TaxID=718192 RepID=A0A4P6P5R6_9GAMM|nr:hypothetical protein [Litorilituus sediminis]QBG35489.1 hypothetical protein EMK97_07045 [Litorilituus sediminis]